MASMQGAAAAAAATAAATSPAVSSRTRSARHRHTPTSRGAGAASGRRPRRAQLLRDWLMTSVTSAFSDPQQIAVKFSFQYEPAAGSNEHVHVVGEPTELGAWDTGKSLALAQTAPGTWEASVALPKGLEFSYRYIIKASDGSDPRPEPGFVRSLSLTKKKLASLGVAVLVHDVQQFPAVGAAAGAGASSTESVTPVMQCSGAVDAVSDWQDRFLACKRELANAQAEGAAAVKSAVAAATRDMEDENAALLRRVESLQEAARISKREADAAREALNKALVAKERLRMNLKGRVAEMTLQNNQLKASHKAAKKNLSRMHGEVREAARSAQQEVQQKLQEHEETVRVLQQRAEAMKKEWAAEVASLKSKVNQQASAATDDAARAALEVSLQEAEAMKASLTASLEKTQTQLQRTEMRTAGLDEQCKKLTTELEAEKRQHSEAMRSARHQHREALKEAQQQHADALDVAKRQLADAQASSSQDAMAATAQLEALKVQLAETQQSLEAQLAETQSSLEAELQASADLRSRIEALVQEQASLNTKLQAQAHELASAEQAWRRVQGEAAQLQQQLVDAQVEGREQLEMAMQESQVVSRELRAKAVRAMEKYTESAAECRHWFNTSMTLKGNIRVFCRVRPMSSREANEGEGAGGVTVTGTRSAVVQPAAREARKFTFDRIFNGDDTQETVFREVSPLVTSTLDGYNVCVFAYGQTGSGKTHTMMGNASAPGVIPRTVQRLFNMAQERRDLISYDFEVSVFEIYNEQIRDLLASGAGSGSGSGAGNASLDVKLTRGGRVTIPGLTHSRVTSAGDVEAVIATAHKNRSVATTSMNAHSSRSHMVLSLGCRSRHLQTGDVTTSNMYLIDLAGSERLSRSQAKGDTLRETQHINKSLSALGDVVHALQTRAKHIPYRNSKLTYLLQNALGGNAKTLMMCQVSPSAGSAGESMCTLQFAKRAAAVKLGNGKGHVQSGAGERARRAVAEAQSKVEALQQELAAARKAAHSAGRAATTKAAQDVAAAKATAAEATEAARKAQSQCAAAVAAKGKLAAKCKALEEAVQRARGSSSNRLAGEARKLKSKQAAATQRLESQVAALQRKVQAAEAVAAEAKAAARQEAAQAARERDEHVSTLEQAVAKLEGELQAKQVASEAQEAQVDGLGRRVQELEQEIAAAKRHREAMAEDDAEEDGDGNPCDGNPPELDRARWVQHEKRKSLDENANPAAGDSIIVSVAPTKAKAQGKAMKKARTGKAPSSGSRARVAAATSARPRPSLTGSRRRLSSSRRSSLTGGRVSIGRSRRRSINRPGTAASRPTSSRRTRAGVSSPKPRTRPHTATGRRARVEEQLRKQREERERKQQARRAAVLAKRRGGAASSATTAASRKPKWN